MREPRTVKEFEDLWKQYEAEQRSYGKAWKDIPTITTGLAESFVPMLIRQRDELFDALNKIADEDEECFCDDHTSYDCCNQNNVFCAGCIARAVVDKVKP